MRVFLSCVERNFQSFGFENLRAFVVGCLRVCLCVCLGGGDIFVKT